MLENLSPFFRRRKYRPSPVRACYRYLNNRPDPLGYQGAIKKGLPIGSGEIESAHRYVIQKRLKLLAAWWKAKKKPR